jgi:hypothetical protein
MCYYFCMEKELKSEGASTHLTQWNEDTFILARKVVDILSAHSNPYEAEAACGMALAVAACRVKQWPFRGRLESKPLPEGLQASHQCQ